MDDKLAMQAKKILNEVIYLTLGTVGEDNVPWVSPLFYAVDEKYNFYWISPKDSWHAKNNKFNKNASWVVFDTNAPKWEGQGVYFVGKCEEMANSDEVKMGLEYIFKRLEEKIPVPEDFLGENQYRVYRGTYDKAWITHDKTENGKTVDARAEIRLD